MEWAYAYLFLHSLLSRIEKRKENDFQENYLPLGRIVIATASRGFARVLAGPAAFAFARSFTSN
jgi:hypothetical protein